MVKKLQLNNIDNFNDIMISRCVHCKREMDLPQKNVLVCAWHAKVKMAALTCFKNSRSWILTRLTRHVQRPKPIKKTDSHNVGSELKRCGWRETIYPADWKRQFRRRF